jgi:hypothetical protein
MYITFSASDRWGHQLPSRPVPALAEPKTRNNKAVTSILFIVLFLPLRHPSYVRYMHRQRFERGSLHGKQTLVSPQIKMPAAATRR